MSEEIRDVVRAKRFELVNDEGKKRPALFSRRDGAVGLSLVAADGDTQRASLGITSAGTATLKLYDEREILRAAMQAAPAGAQAHFSLADAVGRARVQILLYEDGSAGVSISDWWGNRRAALNVSPEGEPVLGFFDEDGRPIGGFFDGQFGGSIQ